MISEKLNRTFSIACAEGDLEIVKKLYEDYDKSKSSIFSAFLSIFTPMLDPHHKEDNALLTSCSYERNDVVKYLLSQQKYITTFKNDSQLNICLSLVMKSGNFELTQLLLPVIQKNKYHTDISLGFNSACAKGYLDIVKYVLDYPNFNWIEYDSKKRDKEDYSLLYTGFISACKRGQLDIIKYLVETPGLNEKIDFNQFHSNLIVNNIDIIRYFIFELDMKKSDSFFSHISVHDNMKYQMEDFFKTKEMYTDINQELNSVDTPKHKQKRLKV